MTNYEKLIRTFDELKVKYDTGGYCNGSFIGLFQDSYDRTYTVDFIFDSEDNFLEVKINHEY